jgi:hypothetical protein
VNLVSLIGSDLSRTSSFELEVLSFFCLLCSRCVLNVVVCVLSFSFSFAVVAEQILVLSLHLCPIATSFDCTGMLEPGGSSAPSMR